MEPIIDPILESVCLPLSEDEHELLEKQLLRDGCLDALKIWEKDGQEILLDGHNRLGICKKHDIPYKTEPIKIDSIDEAIVWIVDNQRGRRNVATKEQLDYISGKKYEATKNIERRRDEAGRLLPESPAAHNEQLVGSGRGAPVSAKKQGEEEGIGQATVRRNAQFAKGVDKVRKVAPDAVDKILKPNTEEKLSKVEVMTIAQIPDETLEKVVGGDIEDIKEVVKEYREEQKEVQLTEEEERKQQIENLRQMKKNIDKDVKELNTFVRETYGSDLRNLDVCIRGVKEEVWCEDCNWGFDIYGPDKKAKVCPYCGSEHVEPREPDWWPGKKVE